MFWRRKGIDKKDVNINQSIDFGSTAAAFSGGQGDYTIEFEPSATLLEQKGDGYVVASVGTESGYVPYTSYSVKQSYLKTHGATVEKFTKALQKGMDFVQTHTPEEIAEVIAPQFAETELETITAIVRRYYEQDTWKKVLNLLHGDSGAGGRAGEKGTRTKDTRDNKYAEEAAAKGDSGGIEKRKKTEKDTFRHSSTNSDISFEKNKENCKRKAEK